MSRFISSKQSDLTPYVPGEQLMGKFIKLNTNESPYSPSEKAITFGQENLRILNKYSDIESSALREKLAEVYGVDKDEVIMSVGADEMINYAFLAFMDEKAPVVFPNITYGFYKVYAQLNKVPYKEIPLKDDFSIDINDYIGINQNIIITNPNAPTGLMLSVEQLEKVIVSNPNNVVVIDEAYVDFGAESCIPLIHKYDNLLVIQTFSKSRSMAGGRLGYGIACKALIQDLNTIKNSMDPYNVSSLTQSYALGILNDEKKVKENIQKVIEAREYFVLQLRNMDFEVLDSKTNFVFAQSSKISGIALYNKLKERNILIRHFDGSRISNFNRISIGTMEEMQTVVENIKEILDEIKTGE